MTKPCFTGLTGRPIHRLTGQLWSACPDTGRGRSWALRFPDRVLLLIPAHRTNLTRQQLAALFGISDFAVHRVTDRLAPHLAELPGPPPADRQEPWIVDRTLIPVHDQARTATSKNDRRSVHTQTVCRARDRRTVAGDTWPGNRNDTTVFRQTPGKGLPEHRRPIGDGGHRGNTALRSPRRGPDGRIVKDRNHRRIRRRRAVAEHTIARPKDHQILRQCRRRGRGIDHTIADVAAPHHLKPATACTRPAPYSGASRSALRDFS
jgi:hypothetical protein